MTDAEVTRLQQAMHPYALIPMTARDHRCVARWWELEAERPGEHVPAFREQCLTFARNYRERAAEIARAERHRPTDMALASARTCSDFNRL